jgi:hypothetical protein
MSRTIRPSDLKLVNDWKDQPCPICGKGLLSHILFSQTVDANYSDRTLSLSANVYCGAN